MDDWFAARRASTPPGKRKMEDLSSTDATRPDSGEPSLEESPKTFAAVLIPTTVHDATDHNGMTGRDESGESPGVGMTPAGHQAQISAKPPLSSGQGAHNEVDTGLRIKGEDERLQTPANPEALSLDKQPTPMTTAELTSSPRTKAKKSHMRDPRMAVTSVIDVSPRARSAPSSKSDGRPESRQSRYQHLKITSLLHASPGQPSASSQGRPESISEAPRMNVTSLIDALDCANSTMPEGRPRSRHKRSASEEPKLDLPISSLSDPSLEKTDTIEESEPIIPSDEPSADQLDLPSIIADSKPEISFSESRHKRFGSEEANDALLESALKKPMLGSVEDLEAASSEDEAPEVVTQSTGLEKARSAVAEATRAAEAQRAAEKEKRRKRDTLLKIQAEATKKETGKATGQHKRPRTPTDDDMVDTTASPPADAPQDIKWPTKDALPELLPDDILAAEPMLRLPTPSPELIVAKAPVNKKQRFLDGSSKPLKDLRKGNVRIRVLEERRGILPPKVSESSQLIRESWLAGRPGAKGKVVMERRKIRGGFIRR
ncbi:MAG: hypothetical protein L6R39_004104 [Caloplaca ligustica]|nr:MAG: hypothetical protein L6R39_004104 [Caloplaca ligustica]